VLSVDVSAALREVLDGGATRVGFLVVLRGS
jgi:hypothetical protein